MHTEVTGIKFIFGGLLRGNDVDFIVYGEDGFWAIVVTASKTVHPGDIKGLKSFKEDYPDASLLLLYRGTLHIKKDGILCIPCEDFLKKLNPREKELYTF